MAYYPNNPNGQATMADSSPVVIASNQTPLSISGTPSITGIVGVSGQTADGFVSTANSSTATLGSNAVFSGTSEEITNYSSVSVYVFSNVSGATDGLSMQQSSDGTNWDIIDVYSVPAGVGKTFGLQCTARFFRVVYTNGSTAQSSFRLQTIFHKFEQRTSSVRPQDGRTNDNDFSETISYTSTYNGLSWDRTRSADAMTAQTNGLQVGLLAVGVGPGHSRLDNTQTITANSQSRTFNARGTEQLNISIAGTWVGTITFEYTIDGSTWIVDTTGIDANTLYQTSGSTTINGTWFFDSSSVIQYRVRSTAWTSGTAIITFVGSIGSVITYGPIINARPDRIGVAHVWKGANYTTTQTGAAIWTPASGKRVNLTRLVVSSYGTTAGRVIIWFGGAADTTYNAGTDQLVLAVSFAPSANSKPGVVENYTLPIQGVNANDVLRITTDAAISLDIAAYGYES